MGSRLAKSNAPGAKQSGGDVGKSGGCGGIDCVKRFFIFFCRPFFLSTPNSNQSSKVVDTPLFATIDPILCAFSVVVLISI